MAESDRSRSPAPGRNRAEPEPSQHPVRQALPFFPRWCGSYAISDLALSTDAASSVQTSVPTSAQYAPVGTVYDDSTNKSISFIADMDKSTTSNHPSKISTCTSFVPTTNTCISTSIKLSHSAMFTYDSMCPNSAGFAQYSIHPVVTTSSFWHSILQVPRRPDYYG